MLAPSPVFICGTPRSGTTLLQRLVDSHPVLAVLPEETFLYQNLLLRRRLSRIVVQASELLDLPRLPEVLARRPLRALAFAGRNALRKRVKRWIQSFEISEPRGRAGLYEDLIEDLIRDVNPPEGYWRPFLEVYQRLTGDTFANKRYWVEKTPSNERFTAINERAFAGRCRYLYLLRDPRDVAASWLSARREALSARARELVRISYLWSLSVHLCSHGLGVAPTRYCVIRYEDLVRRTREVMEETCRFLGIPMDEKVLTPTKLGTAVPINSSYPDVHPAKVVVQSQIRRFPQVLTEGEIHFMETLLAGQMAACGYLPQTRADTGGTGKPPLLPSRLQWSWKPTLEVKRVWRWQHTYARITLPILSSTGPGRPAAP